MSVALTSAVVRAECEGELEFAMTEYKAISTSRAPILLGLAGRVIAIQVDAMP